MNYREPYIVPRRHLIALAVIFSALVLLGARAAYLQIFATDMLQTQGNARYLRNEVIKPNRGLIKDRNGELLAVSTPVDSIWAEPHVLINHSSRWDELAEAVGVSSGRLKLSLDKYNNANRRFMYLKRHLTPQHAAEVESLDVPGVHLLREYRRYYPQGEIASNLVGYTNIDDVGLEGIERVMNSRLEGEYGLRQVLKDKNGRTIETVQYVQGVENGKDVVLSIDARIQHVVHRALADALAKERAYKAISVVVDVDTGEILAIANVPSFNPNIVSDRTITRNFAATDVFEPGSVVKPFLVAKAIMDGVVTPHTVIDTAPGEIRLDGFKISDIRNYGELSVEDIIMKSSNIGVVKIGEHIDPDSLMDFYAQVGFGSETSSGLSGEQPGLFPRRSKWRPSERATLAFGYGFSVTPLQLVQAYAAIANGGVLVPLSIVADDSLLKNRQKIMPSALATDMIAMLEKVVTPTGTAKRAAIPHYRVAGKSATVQKLIDGRYSENNHLAVFVGFAPASDPKIAVAVVVDDPKGEVHYGGAVAAPVFQTIMSKSLRILDIPPDDVKKFATNKQSELAQTETVL